MLDWNDYIKIFISIAVIVNPLGAIPVFVSLTSDYSTSLRNRIARVSALSVGIVLIVACLLGESVLQFFGITLASFRVGGGILLLLLAASMFHARQSRAKHTPEESEEAEDKESIAVVPIGTPLLAGPAAITTVIIYAHKSSGLSYTSFIIVSCVVVAFAVWMTLRLSIRISTMLGRTGINIAIRLMGLIIAAIAVEFITTGLVELLPGLA